ncbi:hypothetical protein [Streptomyces triticirhizae]|uniref:Uncharacterized protein n=1 Tax=Streptomyces triticirhizae TaxID=2483353 RepID=A0A3M2LQS6_9ACTN|nr:hypothetical protein [Streptomyces triticirhizae]RMI39747.1 hypothetical protein EBN88_14245 [Streptomyces triticirhizae]
MTSPLSAPIPNGDDKRPSGPTGPKTPAGGDAPKDKPAGAARAAKASAGEPKGTTAAGGKANPQFGDGGANGVPSGVGTTFTNAGGGQRSELMQLVTQLESMEIRTDRDLYRYARLLRAIGIEMSLRISMDADWLAALLSQYRGRWYTFGAEARIRGRLVAGHLKQGGKAAEVLGMAGVKAYAAFQRHFVKPEIEAQQKGRRSQHAGFTITQAEEKKEGGRA